MNLEEAIQRITELELKFDGLEKTMNVYQEAINNNISWFIGALGIFVSLLGVVGVALYFLVQTAINKGVKSGIQSVTSTVQKEITSIKNDLQKANDWQKTQTSTLKSEIDEFKGNLDQHVIQLIKNNSKIKWAKGTVSRDTNDYVYATGLNGNVDWNSPITNVRVYDPINKKDIQFEFIQRMENGFAFKIDSSESYTVIEWIIVWYEKD